jgi:hypothetical protein
LFACIPPNITLAESNALGVDEFRLMRLARRCGSSAASEGTLAAQRATGTIPIVTAACGRLNVARCRAQLPRRQFVDSSLQGRALWASEQQERTV